MRQDLIQFAGEEVQSQRGYPPGYRVKPLDEQAAVLRRLFPQLTAGTPASLSRLPDGAEGWFVVPAWRKVAASYNGAAVQALDVLAKTRAASLTRRDRLDAAFFRPHARTVDMFLRVPPSPMGDLMVFPAQFGARHRGRSIRRARETFVPTEFGLGLFAVTCMLLTHPERLTRIDQLYVDCAGDEYSASDEQQFSEAPYFRYLDGRVAFGTSWIGYADPYFGSASAFLSE